MEGAGWRWACELRERDRKEEGEELWSLESGG